MDFETFQDQFQGPNKTEIVQGKAPTTVGENFSGQWFTGTGLVHIIDKAFVEQKAAIIKAVRNLHPDEYLVLQQPIIPSRFKDGKAFKNRGNYVELPSPDPVDAMSDETLRPWEQRRDTFNNLPENLVYAGYMWKSMLDSDRRPRRTHLVSSVKGAQIFSFSEGLSIDDKLKVRVLQYLPNQAGAKGGLFIVQVPSVTEKEKTHTVVLQSIPVESNMRTYIVGTGIEADSSSVGDIIQKTHFKDQTASLGMYSIAAYLGIIRRMYEEQKGRYFNDEQGRSIKVPPVAWQMNPFALPRQEAVDLYLKLQGRVLMREHKYEGSNGHVSKIDIAPEGRTIDVRTRPLQDAEIEILLWADMQNKNNNPEPNKKWYYKSTRTRWPDYNWDINTELPKK